MTTVQPQSTDTQTLSLSMRHSELSRSVRAVSTQLGLQPRKARQLSTTPKTPNEPSEIEKKAKDINDSIAAVLEQYNSIEVLNKKVEGKFGFYKERVSRNVFAKDFKNSVFTEPLKELTTRIEALQAVLGLTPEQVKEIFPLMNLENLLKVTQKNLLENYYIKLKLPDITEARKPYKRSLRDLDTRITNLFGKTEKLKKCTEFIKLSEQKYDKHKVLFVASKGKGNLVNGKKAQNSMNFKEESFYIKDIDDALQRKEYYSSISTPQIMKLRLLFCHLMINFGKALKKEQQGTRNLISSLYSCYKKVTEIYHSRKDQVQSDRIVFGDVASMVRTSFFPNKVGSFQEASQKLIDVETLYDTFVGHMMKPIKERELEVDGYQYKSSKDKDAYIYYKKEDKAVTEIVVLCRDGDTLSSNFNPTLKKKVGSEGWVHTPTLDQHKKVSQFLNNFLDKKDVDMGKVKVSFMGFGMDAATAHYTAYQLKKKNENANITACLFAMPPYVSPDVAGEIRNSGMVATNIVVGGDRYTKASNMLKNVFGEFDETKITTTFELPNFTREALDFAGHKKVDYDIALNGGFKVLKMLFSMGNQLQNGQNPQK